MIDEKGQELKVGDRVYVPPRSYGSEDDSMFSKPIFSPAGEEVFRPSISGRVVGLYTRPGDASRFGPYLIIRDKEIRDHFALPGQARKQSGRSSTEKLEESVQSWQEARKKARRSK